jgi:hypothetical protein
MEAMVDTRDYIWDCDSDYECDLVIPKITAIDKVHVVSWKGYPRASDPDVWGFAVRYGEAGFTSHGYKSEEKANDMRELLLDKIESFYRGCNVHHR